jgi:hypothetical protein
MKKSYLIFSLLIVLMIVVLAVPVFADGNEVIVVYGKPKIDAVVDDIWQSVPSYKTLNVFSASGDISDTVSEWRFMWNEERLSVLIVVTDSQLNAQNATYWQNDCTQLFIDFEHSSNFSDYTYENFGAALGIRNCWEGGILTPPDSFVVEALGTGYQYEEGETEYDHIEKAQKTTNTGYIIEYSFDPTLFWPDFNLKAGQQGGIDFCNDDSFEGSTVRDVLFVYSKGGETWSKPNNLSTFTLAAKDQAVNLDAIQKEQEAKAAEAAAAAAAKQAAIEKQIADGVDVVYGTPKIDGDIDAAWEKAPGYKAEYVYMDGEAKSICYPTIKFMWDEDRMYVLVEIKDEQLNAMTHTLWANDNLQFFIDFGHGHDFAANEYNGDGTAIGIRYCWLGGIVDLPEGFTVEALGGGGYYSPDDEKYLSIEKAQKTVGDGWVMEFAIDPTIFAPDFKMEEGAKGGVDYVVDDTNIGNDTGARDTLYVFSIKSDTWGSPKNLIPFTFVMEAKKVDPVAEATVAVATEEVSAPMTFDFGMISIAAAIISLAGYAAFIKRRMYQKF